MVTTEHRTNDPVHRVSMSFERDGGDLWVHTWLQDGGNLPEHYHPTLEELWEVVEGTAEVKVDGKWRTVTADDGVVTVGRNVRHALRNTSGREARLRTRVTPAGRLEEFLRESAWAAQEGLYDARNLPRSLRGALWIAEFAHRFRDETVMCWPPPALQRLVLPPVAALARRRGRG
jgi:mannose-6-phosphate isomerase-like protein (cupin superfamily)